MPLPEGFKPVSAYLPPDILSPLTAYCLEHSLTRKDKQGNLIPSLGSGIVEVLREFFKGNVSSPVPSPLPSDLLSEDEIMGKIEKAIKRDYEENRLPLIQERIDEWGRQLEQGMRESLRIELDSLRIELEGKIRDDQPTPIPPTPDENPLPLFPDWESEPIPPDETNSSNEEGDRPNLIPPTEPNSTLEETVTKIIMDIPTETNSTEPNPFKGITVKELQDRVSDLKKTLKKKDKFRYEQLLRRIRGIARNNGRYTRLTESCYLKGDEAISLLREFPIIPDSP